METLQSAIALPSTAEPLRICLLGELRVLRDGRAIALLGYLVSVERGESRQTLCDLLWVGARGRDFIERARTEGSSPLPARRPRRIPTPAPTKGA